MRRTRPLRRGEGLAEGPELDVAPDVRDVAGAEAAVVQPLHGVVDVEAVGRLARRLDVPGDHRHAEAVRDVAGEHGLAGAGLPLMSRGRSSAMAQLTASTRGPEAM
jgi:hypothetical protein